MVKALGARISIGMVDNQIDEPRVEAAKARRELKRRIVLFLGIEM
jgi:hypothetical protein